MSSSSVGKWGRLLALGLSISITLPGVSAATVLAAPTANVKENVVDSAAEEAALQECIKAIELAEKTGKQADIDRANALIAALSPANRLKLYIYLSKDFYFKNYLTPGFRYFNVDEYLSNNDDVREAAAKVSPQDVKAYAIKHYLEHGIYEGRSSGTDFEPVVAVIDKKEIVNTQTLSGDDAPGKSVPDKIYDAYVNSTGSTKTEKKASEVIAQVTKQNPTEPAVQEKKTYVVVPVTYDEDDDDEYYDDDDYDYDDYDDDDEEFQPTPSRRTAAFLNNQSFQMEPYILYNMNGENKFAFKTAGYPGGKNDGLDVEVEFFSENYKKAKELSQGKNYTFMIYMCGTDQEVNEKYRRVSVQLASMMQADMDNINVVLCLGGTTGYGNSYMNSGSDDLSASGLSGLRSGVYYVNPKGLSDDVRNRLAKLDLSKSDDMLQILEGKDKDEKGIAQGLTFNDLINSSSFIQLSTTSAIDMADPGLLAGFINLSTALFPADNYGLSLSNHGGGLDCGIITSAPLTQDGKTLIEKNTISMPHLESALAATELFQDESVSGDGKLGLIFYDACLMGSTEHAYNTKDYYRYMVASEELTTGETEYNKLLTKLNSNVKEGASDRKIAIDLCQDFKETKWHNGNYYGREASIAAYSSSEMENMYDNINALSRELSSTLKDEGYSNAFKTDVFTAVRSSAIGSYPTNCIDNTIYNMLYDTKFIDIGEFMNGAYKNLNKIDDEKFSDSEKQALSTIKEKLESVLQSGFLVFLSSKNFCGFGEITTSRDEGVIPLNYIPDGSADTAIWSDIKKDPASDRNMIYASSIFMPLGGTATEFKNSDMYKFYNGTSLQDYVQFISDYLDFYNDENGYLKNRTELAKELKAIGSYSKLITQDNSEGYAKTLKDEYGTEMTYIAFKVADSYEDAGIPEDKVPEHSTGSPMLDIIETQDSMQITAIHSEYFDAVKDDGTEGFLRVDMICAEDAINLYNYGVDGNTLMFNVSGHNKTIMNALGLNGNAYNSETDSADTSKLDYQFVLKSFIDKYSADKRSAIQALGGSDKDLSEFLTVAGSVLTKKDAEDGSKPSIIKTTYAYHIFEQGDDSKYNYRGTVSYNQDRTYSKFEDPIAISAYHYALATDKDEAGNVIKSYKTVMEDNKGIDDGYYVVPTADNNGSLYIKINGVMENVGVDGKDEYTIDRTAFVVDPDGLGTSYSDIAYVKDPIEYLWGENVGDGQLAKVRADQTDPAYIKSIGEFVYGADHSADTEIPSEPEDIEEYINLRKEKSEGVVGFAEDTAPAQEPPVAETAATEVTEVYEYETEDGRTILVETVVTAPNENTETGSTETEVPVAEATEAVLPETETPEAETDHESAPEADIPDAVFTGEGEVLYEEEPVSAQE